jgi:hypothetical protein
MTDAALDEPQPPPDEKPSRLRWVKRLGRPLLLIIGIGAIVLLVRDAGPSAVLHTLLSAGVWLPLILLLEVGWMTMDVVALRSLLGEPARKVPFAAWVRSAMLAYGIMILLPGGRAGGEVARAHTLAPFVGGARSAAVATRLQSVTLLANTLISIPCFVAVWWGAPGAVLAWMVLGNAVVTGLVGGGIMLATRRANVGQWLGKRIRALASHGPSYDEALRDSTPYLPAIAATSGGRALQALQYGVLLAAVGGSFGLVSSLVSQAIHLVGAGLGDFVPNAAGITETAYRVFAPALGLEHEPARAISIAILARICQYVIAGVCLGVGSVWTTGARNVQTHAAT